MSKMTPDKLRAFAEDGDETDLYATVPIKILRRAAGAWETAEESCTIAIAKYAAAERRIVDLEESLAAHKDQCRADNETILASAKYYHAAEALLSQMDWGRSALTGPAIGDYNEAAVAMRPIIAALEAKS